MESLFIGIAIAAVVTVIAFVARSRQRTDAPTQREYHVPAQIDRSDFGAPDEEWLIVVFTSSTCPVCSDVSAKAAALASRHVATRVVDHADAKAVHDRYGIDAVPTLVIADPEGVVRHHVLGPVSATDLWAAVARIREGSDSSSLPCEHH